MREWRSKEKKKKKTKKKNHQKKGYRRSLAVECIRGIR